VPSHFRRSGEAIDVSPQVQSCILHQLQPQQRHSRPTMQDGVAGMVGAKVMLPTARVHEYTDFFATNVYTNTYTEPPRGRAPSTPTPTRGPLEAGRHPHRHLDGVPANAGWQSHQVYFDIHKRTIGIVQAPTRRSHTPLTCPSSMKQTTTCFADEAKASHPVRHRQGGHHQAWHRRGEGRPHLHHWTSTSRWDTAKHRRSDGRTAPPFYITTTPSSPSWRRRGQR
jgi:hypothetical protein